MIFGINSRSVSLYINCMILVTALSIFLLHHFGVLNFNISFDREMKLKIMDVYSKVRLNLSFVEHEKYIQVPYSDIVEERSGTRWINGVRTFSNAEVAIIVVDVHESLLNSPNIDRKGLNDFIARLNVFLKKSSSLGIRVFHYHSPWEGGVPLAKLEKSSLDINILSIQDEEDVKNIIKKYKMVMLVGTAGDKCVLTRPLGLIELNRLGVQTVYLHDLMIYFGAAGKPAEFAANDFMINLVALNWGYVGAAESFININQ